MYPVLSGSRQGESIRSLQLVYCEAAESCPGGAASPYCGCQYHVPSSLKPLTIWSVQSALWSSMAEGVLEMSLSSQYLTCQDQASMRTDLRLLWKLCCSACGPALVVAQVSHYIAPSAELPVPYQGRCRRPSSCRRDATTCSGEGLCGVKLCDLLYAM